MKKSEEKKKKTQECDNFILFFNFSKEKLQG
jgi:hypothetical protein